MVTDACAFDRSTGMQVAVTSLESPIVSVSLYVPTEVFGDDGAPHVLEHLLFHRSQDFPYKNWLRLSAPRYVRMRYATNNDFPYITFGVRFRFLAGGINAGTYQDYTVYYFKAAGSDGALRFMTQFINQMLYASLTEGDVLTEAHHIDGEGVDGGVVYSEMKGINAKTSWQLRSMVKQLLYPNNSSYSFNRGGSLEGLSTIDRDRIVDYHSKFYRLENVLAVVHGGVTAEEVLTALEDTKLRALERGKDRVENWSPALMFDTDSSPGPDENVDEVIKYEQLNTK